jgi:hypothetical protein
MPKKMPGVKPEKPPAPTYVSTREPGDRSSRAKKTSKAKVPDQRSNVVRQDRGGQEMGRVAGWVPLPLLQKLEEVSLETGRRKGNILAAALKLYFATLQ